MLRIGHRGACGYETENTLASFQKAMDLKVDMIEFDVQLCKSGEAIIMHDEKINQTTNGKGAVKNLSLDEIKKVDTRNGERVPTLNEALALIDRKVLINIELKSLGTALAVADSIAKITQDGKWKTDDFLISSFNWNELEKFHELLPEIKTGILVGSRIKGLFQYSQKNILHEAKKMNAYSVHFPLSGLSKSKAHDMQKNGLKVFVYTVNEFSDIKQMEEFGVDGVFSNYPDRIS